MSTPTRKKAGGKLVGTVAFVGNRGRGEQGSVLAIDMQVSGTPAFAQGAKGSPGILFGSACVDR